MSEDAFGAIEETVTSFEAMNVSEEKNNDLKEKKNTQANMRTQAKVKPEPVDDTDVSLKDELKNGFVAAYQSRIGG